MEQETTALVLSYRDVFTIFVKSGCAFWIVFALTLVLVYLLE